MPWIQFFIPDSLKSTHDVRGFTAFVQHLGSRLQLGGLRYTRRPRREAKYMTRIKLELKAYRRTGNREHLLNIANYCHLECMAPENPRHHFDNSVGSATRGRKELR